MNHNQNLDEEMLRSYLQSSEPSKGLEAEKSQRESQREPERTSESQREPERARKSQKEPERAREGQREPERARVSQTANQRGWPHIFCIHQHCFVAKQLKTTLLCCETLKYGTFCRKTLKYAL